MAVRTTIETPGDVALFAALRDRVHGALIRPGDDGYDDARRVWNGRVDRRPGLVLRCADVADVRHGLLLAQDAGVAVSVRGSGHNAAGFAVRDGGLTLDLSAMTALRVDPNGRRVQSGPGVSWHALDQATQEHRLATTGGRISTTGVGGLTLGGGYGWLMRSCGLAIDNLRAVELVTADGRIVHASAANESELFWGLRGGGGNFGVATAFEYELHEVGQIVTGGAAFYPMARARDLLSFFRDFVASASDELGVLLNFLVAPDAPFMPPELRGTPVAAIAVCHTGSPAAAQRSLAALRDLGPPLLDRIGPLPYVVQQRLYDAAGVFGRSVRGRSGLLDALDDTVIDAVAERAPSIMSPFSIVMITALGGAVARVGESETAFAHRRAAYNISIEAVWTDSGEPATHVAWVEDLWAAVAPSCTGVYVNELGDEGAARVREAYPPATYARLAALKDVWDPTNVFDLNQNVPPTR
jgi:FAD/FMN-containing dehydrogenase